MNVLQRLAALAEPDFTRHLALNPRIFGFLIAAFAFLSFVAARNENAHIVAALVAALPQLLAFSGGVRLVRGDMHGKRSVVCAMGLATLYLVAQMLVAIANVGPCGDGPLVCEAAVLLGLLVAIPTLAFLAFLLYGFVGALGYRTLTRTPEKIVSAVVTVVACVGVLAYASAMIV